MKCYKSTLKPLSAFGTPLKGDTLWGHLCWMIRYRYGNDRLETLLMHYREGTPFLIVSDAFYDGYLPKPKMPSVCLGEETTEKKENRKRVWLTPEDLQDARYGHAKKESEVTREADRTEVVVKNSINYETFGTGEGAFAPYGSQEHFFNTPKNIYFLLDETQLSYEELTELLQLFSEHGYGKDISTGKGRFEITKPELVSWKNESRAYMTLSPAAIEAHTSIEQVYYEPFVRFGKFGGNLAKPNPFKRPLLMMETGSVIVYRDIQLRHFAGRSIDGLVSRTDPNDERGKSLHQGYAILFPIKEPSCNP